ncbi:MAG: phosphatidylglycerophosphatase A [Spirochaetes bacterium]|nr:phosphatidylglycerophosphatase A [Spirochaetota bacterium]
MKDLLKKFIITGFFTGYTPVIPGTAGSLLAAILFAFVQPYPLLFYFLLSLFFILGILWGDWAKTCFKKSDPPQMVLDEFAGIFITFMGLNFTIDVFSLSPEALKILISGFILFRLFDITKPFPIKKAEKMKGSWGIMMDDVLAGIYANLILRILIRINFL